MPMQSSTFFWASDLVMHGDLESITPVSLQFRRRELIVNKKDTLVHAIRG